VAKRFRVLVYPARDGWRWHTISRNGKIVAESGEAYMKKGRCIDMAVALAPEDSTVEIAKG
jgi:uncharacterized protein YegP (UPF0339 family)